MKKTVTSVLIVHQLAFLLGSSRNAFHMGGNATVGLSELKAKASPGSVCTQCEGCDPFSEWSACDGGWQYRQSYTCEGVREQRECNDSSGECGPWTPWIPSDRDCVAPEMQERHRHGCPTYEETKVCIGFHCNLCHAKANCDLAGGMCTCKPGYDGDGYYCSDINECTKDPQICGDHASCTNIGGDYLCACDSGYRVSGGKPGRDNECQNINECTEGTYVCDPNASCSDTEGSYGCVCNVGFEGTGKVCTDADLCEDYTDCQPNSTCEENSEGTDVICTCNAGYELSSTTPNTCVDINECPDGKGTAACSLPADGGICNNTEGSYTCACETGYTLVDDVTCQDNNECQDGTAKCDSTVGSCTNTGGSYTCSCIEGYTLAEDGYTCNDVDECSQKICGENVTCTNNTGGYTCECVDGYRPAAPSSPPGPGNFCVDINECLEDSDNCSAHASCTNSDGSFSCACNEGYDGNGVKCTKIACHDIHDPCDDLAECSVADGATEATCTCQSGYSGLGTVGECHDINECEVTPDICGAGAQCANTIGSYTCTCVAGYRKNGDKCQDINECTEGTHECGANTRCVNEVPHYHCVADPGYRLNPDGKTATDIDECAESSDNCGDNASCFNVPGSFNCPCDAGYVDGGLQGGKQVCVDRDECALGLDNCDPNAVCHNNDGGFSCECKCAYEGEGTLGKCQDIRFCERDDCNEHATCAETSDHCSYTCTCGAGYTGDGHGISGCTDIDECLDIPCPDNAKCTNSAGSYSCACNDGYREQGDQCVNIDECTEDTDDCDDTNGICTDEPAGSYTCSCKPGYEWIGERDPDGNKVCVDKNECTGLYPERCPLGDEYACFNYAGGFDCNCVKGYVKNENDVCVDVDECDPTIIPGVCGPNASCQNSIGGYACNCHPGYQYQFPDNDGKGEPGNPCIDYHECDLGLDDCHDNAICENTPGSYTCTCRQGYEGDGKYCKDLNLCDKDHIPCHPVANCAENEDGSEAVCTCPRGYTGNGIGVTGCVDINECLDPSVSGCDSEENGGTCEDYDGGWSCGCREGWYMSWDKSCKNIDECQDPNVSGCDPAPRGTCEDYAGGWTCGCSKGYTLQEDGHTCVDDNECLLGTDECGPNSTCTNTIPGYTCDCHEGYAVKNPGELNPGHVDNPCQNINECDDDPCDDNASCTDSPGSFTCTCNIGWVGDGFSCADKQWCEGVTCPANSSCKETDKNDGYYCQCNKGYSGESGLNPTCTNIDECHSTEHPHDCADVPGMKCEDSEGSYACVCEPGWMKQGTICVDVDECTDGTHNCDTLNGGCDNNDGAYTCRCNNGFRLNADGHTCDDILECSEKVGDTDEPVHQCSANARCIEEVGSYSCACNPGYRSITATKSDPCQNIDECTEETDTCAPRTQATCSDTEGSYTCQCNIGWEGDGYTCTPHDWCGLNSCHPEAECEVLEHNAGYMCVCGTGWQGTGEDTDDGCIDINECLNELVHKCTSSDGDECVNTDGGFHCQCKAGYTRDEYGVCVDVNECNEDPSLCDRIRGTCINETGSYRCSCNEGYALQEDDTCKDIDECADSTLNICHVGDGADCRNTDGSYECFCEDGYRGDGTAACTDINECTEGSHLCKAHSSCRNYTGGHRCVCDPGYAAATADDESRGKEGNECENIDECTLGTDLCDDVATCHDSEGSYTCTCPVGYILKGDHTCEDIDWCGPKPCHPSAMCAETADGGSFTCTCMAGYEPKPGQTPGVGPDGCQDIDECTVHREYCASAEDGGICTNTVGSYTCSCEAGFNGDGRTCTPINECADSSLNNCAPNISDCTDERNGFSCACKAGYSGDGVTCTDIDECADLANYCGPNVTCENSIGGYDCTCKPGFEPTTPGQEPSPSNPCINIDECTRGTHDCHKTKATCTDNVPSPDNPEKYTCACNLGYEGDGRVCNMIVACKEGASQCVEHAECDEAGDGINFDCTCVEGYSGNGFVKCTNIDECAAIVPSDPTTHLCPDNSQCHDLPGTYECICDNGYKKQGDACVDKDECTNGSHLCDLNSTTCYNNAGGYTCPCLSGYEANDTETSCTDIDECTLSSPCPSPATCTNTPGAYICTCPCGYTGQGTEDDPCVNIDESVVGGHDCSPFATVEDTEGSWLCHCLPGYRGSGQECEDIDYCGEATHPANTTCQEIDNAPVFSCVSGYIVEEGKNVDVDGCVDHNECEDPDYTTTCAIPGGKCTNIAGSYTCSCVSGYTGNGQECDDVDECLNKYGGCTPSELGGSCSNTIGSFECGCTGGRLLGADGITCNDINECTAGTHDCLNNSTCNNIDGGFTCPCDPGYDYGTGRPGSPCTNVNECTKGTHECEGVATCRDTIGSYACDCPPGYESTESGLGCNKINPCDTAGCNANADCIASADGLTAQCSCHDGYSGSGVGPDGCADDNECLVNNGGCAATASCKNTVGSFTCTCSSGYTGDGYTCTDVNECNVDTPCSAIANSVCQNTVGSYQCNCIDHYEMDSGFCKPIDYCANPEAVCGPNGVCKLHDNGDGYTCTCPIGMESLGEGQGCKAVNNVQPCAEWQPWTSCKVHMPGNNLVQTPVQSRSCVTMDTYYESRECPHDPNEPPADKCGAWGPWSECTDYTSPQGLVYQYQHRSRQHKETVDGCALYEERRDCLRYKAQGSCEPLGQASYCGVPVTGMQYRVFENCPWYYQLQQCTEGDDTATTPAPGTQEGECRGWGAWSPCQDGVQMRVCGDAYADTQVETRICDASAVPDCGEWSPWSDCGSDNLTHRERAGCGVKEVAECGSISTQPGLEEACGDFSEWGRCQSFESNNLQFRQLGICPHYEAAGCGQTPGAASAEDYATCNDWGPWTACDAIEKTHQTRNCLSHSAQEKRECPTAVQENCGAFTAYSNCEHDVMVRHRENCADMVEVTMCATKAEMDGCGGEPAEFGVCGGQIPTRRLRSMGDCGVYEMEECVLGTTEPASGEGFLQVQDDYTLEEAEAAILGFNSSCANWSVYSDCDSASERHRACEDNPALTETTACNPTGECGEWLDWEEVDDVYVARHREGCPLPEERMEKATVEQETSCGRWGEWDACGSTVENMQFRHRVQCLAGCECVEAEECVQASAPPPGETSSTTPAPGEGPGTTPGEGSGPTPGEGTGTTPGEGSGTTPGEGSGTTPGEGSGTTPGEGSGTTPGEGSGTTPGEGSGTTPGEGAGTTPGDGSGTETTTKAPTTEPTPPTETTTQAPGETETPPTGDDESGGDDKGEKSESAGGGGAAIAGGIIGAVVIGAGVGGLAYYSSKGKATPDDETVEIDETGVEGAAELSEQEEVIEFEEDAWAEDV